MRAEVSRNVETGTDPLENPLPPRFETHLPWVPCYFWRKAGRTAISEEITAIVEDLRMIVPRATDVTEADRITHVWDRRGEIQSDETWLVHSVMQRRDHKELVLESVQ